jgi:transposase
MGEPDEVIGHAPAQCDCGQGYLNALTVAEVRQVFELPPLRMQVTEHRVLQAQCCCGKVHRGHFPNDVGASVQCGPAALAAMVYLNQHHMLPVQRTAGLMNELFGLPVSQAIGKQLQAAAVEHADETGLRVAKKLHWMHVLATQTLAWMARHTKRGGRNWVSCAASKACWCTMAGSRTVHWIASTRCATCITCAS